MSEKIKIIADDKIPFLKTAPLPESCELTLMPGNAITRAELQDADALITRTRTKCNAASLEGTRVRFIATATIGFDHIDTEYCRRAGIFWTNAPGCNADSVAQYMVSVLLTLAEKNELALSGKTLGIIGVGNVGKRVERMAAALGMKVLLNDPPREQTEGSAAFTALDDLLRNSDFVSLHVPLIRQGEFPTFHLADTDFFHKIKPGAFFINASRGEAMDTAAVLEAIDKKFLCGTAIDVWENEPEISRELLAKTDIATPHIAGYSTDGKGNGTAASVHALASFFHLSGLEDWYPILPEPENKEILPENLIEAVRFSYDVRKDDVSLRNTPELFEKLRGNYPLRREFKAYTVKTADHILREQFRKLGFIC